MVGYSISHPQITHTHTPPQARTLPSTTSQTYIMAHTYHADASTRGMHTTHCTQSHHPLPAYTPHIHTSVHTSHTLNIHAKHTFSYATHMHTTHPCHSPPYTSHTHTIHPCHIQRSTHFTHAISILCPPTTYTHHTHATDTYIHTSHAYTYLPTHDKEYMSHIYLPPTYYTHTCTHKHPAHVMSNRAANIQAAVCPPHRSHSLRVPGRPVETHTQAETGLTRADQDPWGHPVLPASAICTRFPGKSHTLTHAQSSRNPSQPRSSKSLRR